MNLNPAQQEAVDLDHPRLVCRAAPGSGKTRVLTERAARILSIPGIHPSEVAMITFTRAAASEMRERLEKRLPGKRRSFWNALTVTTFHSWALQMLRMYHDRLGYPPHFTIRDTDTDRDDVVLYAGRLLDLLPRPGEKKKAGQLTSARGLWGRDAVRDIYRRLLREACALDIDMIEEAFHVLLLKDDGVRAHLRDRFVHVFVDEYQDTSELQQRILDVLEPRNLFRVGDPGQSLYSFRAANPEGFHEACARAESLVIDLPTNYRSRAAIVDAASRLSVAMDPPGLRQEPGRDDDADPNADEPIAVLAAPTREALAARIVNDVRAQHEAGFAWRDAAILSPTWDLLEEILPALTEAGIPARLARKTADLWDEPEVKWLLNCARVALNRDDHLALWAACNAFTPRLSLEVWSRMREASIAEGTTIRDVFMSATPHTCMGVRLAILELMSERSAWVGGLALTMRGAALHLVEDLTDLHLDTRASNLRNEFGVELDRWIATRAEQQAEGEVLDLQAFLDWHAERHVHADVEVDEEVDEVTLASIHGAKGREWPCVWVLGLEEGRLPKSKEPGPGMEEERRKAYVAISRGKERVRMCVSYHHSPSRFVREALPAWTPESMFDVGVDPGHGPDRSTVTLMFVGEDGTIHTLGGISKATFDLHPEFHNRLVEFKKEDR